MTQINTEFISQRKFFQHLACLKLKEATDFQFFATSSYQKLTAAEKAILTAAIPFAPKFEITEEQLLTTAKKEAEVKPERLNYYLHQLFTTLEKWMIMYEIREDEIMQKKLLLRAYKRRFQYQAFFKTMDEALNLTEEDRLDIPETWLTKHQLNKELFYHLHTEKSKPKVDSLEDFEKNLDLYYHGIKIRLFNQRNVRSAYLNAPHKDEPYSYTLKFVEEKQELTFFYLYHQLTEYKKNPTQEILLKLIKDYKLKRLELDRQEQAIFISLIVNSLIGGLNAGQMELQNIQFDLLHFAFENDLVKFDNQIPSFVLNNYIVSAGLTGNINVGKKALKEYIPLIQESIRKDLQNLLYCSLLYNNKKFGEAGEKLRNHQFRNEGLKLRSRNLLIKCHYEYFQDKSDFVSILDSELTNFKRFVKKQIKWTEEKRILYLNMITVIRKLKKVRHGRRHLKVKMKEELSLYINKPDLSIMSKPWLLEKIEQL